MGGHIPRGFIPAIDKGVQETTCAMASLAGFPMIDVKVAVYEGSYHPCVDSNEMAFKTAAALVSRRPSTRPSPVLLEPMAHLKITVPDSYAGSVMGDVPPAAARGHVRRLLASLLARRRRGHSSRMPRSRTMPRACVRSRGTGEFELSSGYEQVLHDIQQSFAADHAARRAAPARSEPPHSGFTEVGPPGDCAWRPVLRLLAEGVRLPPAAGVLPVCPSSPTAGGGGMAERLVIGHCTALDFWRASRVASEGQHVLDDVGRLYGGRDLRLKECAALAANLCNSSTPVDAVVDAVAERRRCSDICDHVSGRSPRRTFMTSIST